MQIDRLVQIAMDNGGLVTRRQALAAGVPNRFLTTLVRSGALARVARGVYAVGSRLLADPGRIALGMAAVLSWQSAVAWYGVDLTQPVDLVHVTASRNRGRRADAIRGVRLHRADLRRGDVWVVRGVPVTSPLRTALDLARHLPLEQGVAVVDAFIRAKLLTARTFADAAGRSAGPGRRRIQLVATLVDPQSGSVLESLARVLLWRHQLVPPRSQHAFRDPATNWFGRLDFAWPDLKVALECDGYEFHTERGPFQRDRRRWSALTRNGWHLGVVTWFDVTRDPDYVVRLVRDLLALESPPLHTTVTPAVA
ncbi:MAG TPA: type IV toxin-antitoxin system AbiEi family antitoxin domain-containing protein [Mycobacteriales bacterium]|nr:type IV toxin-antitoxin system AbiEi family antitoxin domain-containing protein [Mycobacteriales bacterium]